MAETMNHRSIFLANVTIISVLAMSMSLETETNNRTIGFSVNLVHIDSPQSPFYNSTLSSSQRLVSVLQRSLNRFHLFNTRIKYFRDPPQTDLTFAHGEYLIKYSIGTPPTPTFAVADTGSDIIWTQCQPCVKCFHQNLPLFNAKSSSTYSKVPCMTTACRSFGQTICDKNQINCLYEGSYGDGSYTKGVVSRDTVTLPTPNGRSWSFPFIKFGCGIDNGGLISRIGGSGIVGLGGGETSLISQLDYVIQGKFSYCLVSRYIETFNTSKMNFGENAIVSGAGTVSTPLTTKLPSTFYYLTLEGVSIDGERLDFYDYSSNSSKVNLEGNIFIDTGTIITYLPQDFYDQIKEKVKRLIYYRQVSHKILDLCYFSRHEIFIFPYITFHFKGADVKLKAENIFIRLSDTTICLVILPTKFNRNAMFGNLAQRNFLVGFDLKKKTVSFKPTNCGRS